MILTMLKNVVVFVAAVLSGCAGLPDQDSSMPNDSAVIINSADDYVSVVERVAIFKTHYPPSAMFLHQQGTCVVRLTIARSGKMLSASILKSSNSKTLDDECLRVYKENPQFPAIPSNVFVGLDIVDIDVPQVFTIDKDSL